MSDDDIFDALPKSTHDEWGSWATAKPQAFRDVFSTPEAYRAATNAAMRRDTAPRRYTSHLTADGAIAIDHLTGAIYDVTPEDQ